MKRLLLTLLAAAPLCAAAAEAVSPRLTGGQAPAALALDLAGSRTLALTVEVGGDTYDRDQAIWGEARVILKDGTRVPSFRMTRASPQMAWSRS